MSTASNIDSRGENDGRGSLPETGVRAKNTILTLDSALVSLLSRIFRGLALDLRRDSVDVSAFIDVQVFTLIHKCSGSGHKAMFTRSCQEATHQ